MVCCIWMVYMLGGKWWCVIGAVFELYVMVCWDGRGVLVGWAGMCVTLLCVLRSDVRMICSSRSGNVGYGLMPVGTVVVSVSVVVLMTVAVVVVVVSDGIVLVDVGVCKWFVVVVIVVGIGVVGGGVGAGAGIGAGVGSVLRISGGCCCRCLFMVLMMCQ